MVAEHFSASSLGSLFRKTAIYNPKRHASFFIHHTKKLSNCATTLRRQESLINSHHLSQANGTAASCALRTSLPQQGQLTPLRLVASRSSQQL